LSELLVCVDGSEKSKRILDYAITLAKRQSSKIVLVHVASWEGVPERYVEYALKEKVDLASYFEAVGSAILAKMNRDLQESGVPFETILETGNATSKIIDAAKSRKVEMIVIGLQGLHGLNRIRSLGSVSRRVLENAPCPVIVVHDES
jgi:nucleotide-binding universal stress UspA family protein